MGTQALAGRSCWGPKIINQKSEIRNQKFPKSHRLHGRRAFSAVFDAKVRKNAGPLLLFTKPNGLPHWRLGLSVGRRVGNAVTRSKHKRLLREAFRLTQGSWPRLSSPDGDQGYDLVIVVRPHELLSLDEYQDKLTSGVTAAHRTWAKRRRTKSETPQRNSANSD